MSTRDPQSKRPKIELPSRKHKISWDRLENLPPQIADDICELIRSGTLKNMLPSEPTLEEAYGVSRVTVRSAIKILKEAGIVTPRQGRGTIITGKPPRRARTRR